MMTEIAGAFTGSELKAIREMTLAIWGVEFDGMKLYELRNEVSTFIVPIVEYKIPWIDMNESVFAHKTPQFKQERIEIDRWLIPWKVKAGYGPESNLLVYRRHDG